MQQTTITSSSTHSDSVLTRRRRRLVALAWRVEGLIDKSTPKHVVLGQVPEVGVLVLRRASVFDNPRLLVCRESGAYDPAHFGHNEFEAFARGVLAWCQKPAA